MDLGKLLGAIAFAVLIIACIYGGVWQSQQPAPTGRHYIVHCDSFMIRDASRVNVHSNNLLTIHSRGTAGKIQTTEHCTWVEIQPETAYEDIPTSIGALD